MNESDRWIAAQNIDRFKEKLDAEVEPAKRKVLRSLLKQEQRRLKGDRP